MALEGVRRPGRFVTSAARSNLAWAHIERRPGLSFVSASLLSTNFAKPWFFAPHHFVLNECAHSVGKMAPRAPIFVRHNKRVKLTGKYFHTLQSCSLIRFCAGLSLHLRSLMLLTLVGACSLH